MPSKNAIKTFVEDNYYHVYNRGVEKKRIFEDREDYEKFIRYLYLYLAPPQIIHEKEPLLRLNMVRNNLSEEVKLLAFCLMPNHFHLLLHQKTKNGISRLMKQISTAYSMYYNKRYDRIGHLFQGIYKGVLVDRDDYLLYLSRYIHLNPIERGGSLKEFPWSSYKYYVFGDAPPWLETKIIAEYFSNSYPNSSYENFVDNSIYTPPEAIKSLMLE